MKSYPSLTEKIVFKKKSLSNPVTKASLLCDSSPLTQLIIDSKTRIEDVPNCAFVDFANERIGGASLSSPAVQEEILFAIFPEACVSMGLFDRMNDLQAISLENLIRCANYTGYASSFSYKSPFFTYEPLAYST